MSILANAISTSIPLDGQLNILPETPVQSLDFDVAEGTEVELVYDPDEDQPFRIQVGGITEETYWERAEAEIAFQNLLVAIAEANREAQYQEADRRAGR
jgi:hypothetical protein